MPELTYAQQLGMPSLEEERQEKKQYAHALKLRIRASELTITLHEGTVIKAIPLSTIPRSEKSLWDWVGSGLVAYGTESYGRHKGIGRYIIERINL